MKKLNSQMPPVIAITVQRRTKKYLDTAVRTQLVGIAESCSFKIFKKR